MSRIDWAKIDDRVSELPFPLFLGTFLAAAVLLGFAAVGIVVVVSWAFSVNTLLGVCLAAAVFLAGPVRLLVYEWGRVQTEDPDDE